MKFIFNLVLLLVIVGILYYVITNIPPTGLTSVITGNSNQSSLGYPSTTTIQNNTVPQNVVIAYTLSLVNHDRNTYGLSNVSYSSESSAQQHAESMLDNGYFSHWDIYGMKPYMRYTLLGGRGAVDENVAFIENTGGVNVIDSIRSMENSMLNNDSVCCNNGHRDNILDPNHNQLSIGVAYNKTTVFLVQDFIDNYTTWFYGTPTYTNGEVVLKGATTTGYSIGGVQIFYDQPVQNLTPSQLKQAPYNGPYNNGQAIAGVAYTQGLERFFYPNITNINASTYTIQGQDFDIQFNMQSVVQNQGAGEYTITILMRNATSTKEFIGSTYTVFINSDDQMYVPLGV